MLMAGNELLIGHCSFAHILDGIFFFFLERKTTTNKRNWTLKKRIPKIFIFIFEFKNISVVFRQFLEVWRDITWWHWISSFHVKHEPTFDRFVISSISSSSPSFVRNRVSFVRNRLRNRWSWIWINSVKLRRSINESNIN